MAEADSIVATLRDEIAAERYDSRLPTVRELMRRFSATQFAVQSAVDALKREGIVETQVGRGTFVAGKLGDTKRVGIEDARILLLTHTMSSGRGDEVASAVYDDLSGRGASAVSISYNDSSSIEALLGQNSFDVCVLQPRRSIISSRFMASVKQCARHVIVEGRNLERMDVDLVLRDRLASVRLAVDHLRDLGHTRVGLISERSAGAAGYDEIERIFLLYAAAWRAESAPILAVDRGDDDGGGRAIADALTDTDTSAGSPTAYVVSGRFSGRELKDTFDRLNIVVPGDVSVVRLRAIDDTDGDGGFFTSVARKPRQIAEAIRELIDWRLQNPGAPSAARLDHPRLAVRKSTAKP